MFLIGLLDCPPDNFLTMRMQAEMALIKKSGPIAAGDARIHEAAGKLARASHRLGLANRRDRRNDMRIGSDSLI